MSELYYKCMVLGLKFCERKDATDHKLYVITHMCEEYAEMTKYYYHLTGTH